MKIVDGGGKSKVWVIERNTIKSVPVNIGMTDGTHTQILSGVSPGQVIVTGVSAVTNEDETTANSSDQSPFGPKGPGQKKK